jgi:sterol desaturase/sphingolipid hydroxylase (fatty acid hydroxylase superfamily)
MRSVDQTSFGRGLRWPSIANVKTIALACMVVALPSAIVVWDVSRHTEALFDRFIGVFTSLYTRALSPMNGVYLFAVALTFLIEIVVLGYRDSSLKRLFRPSRSATTDLFCLACSVTGLGYILTYFMSFGLAPMLSDKLSGWTPHGVFALENPVLQTFWILLAGDFLKYCLHFLQHKVGFWWETHKFHHAATEMNIITSARGHPFEGVFDMIAMAVPNALLDGSAAQFVLLSVITTVYGGINHSMLEWRWGWVGRWIFNSPVNHRIHHSAQPEHFDRNFASIFVFWDRLFGTYYKGTVLNQTVDVDDNPYNRKNLAYDLFLCIKLSLSKMLVMVLGSVRLVREIL